jgi:DNA polymerase-3 subunit epsilon
MGTLIFDTETTGLPKKYGPEDGQPHIVQLAAILINEENKIVSQLNHIIKPEGWVITDEIAKIHGIDMATAEKYGLSRAAVLAMFSNLVKRADLVVAHNAQFDMQITTLQYKRQGQPSPLLGKEVYCTADNSCDILKLPPTQRMQEVGFGNKFKRPTLKELHQYLFWWWDERAAHDAMGDAEACMRCYLALTEKIQSKMGKKYEDYQH